MKKNIVGKMLKSFAAVLLIVVLAGNAVLAEDDGPTDHAADEANSVEAMTETGDASLEVGEEIFYPSQLGNYSTNYFTVNGKIAYCLQSAVDTPVSGDYVSQVLDNELIQKALYYGMGGPGQHQLFSQEQIDTLVAYLLTHITLSYFYSGGDAFTGITQEALESCGVWSVINWIKDAPAVPTTDISFSESSSETTAEGDIQVSDIITLNADSSNSVSITLPAEITYHNADTNQSQTGGIVTITGGTKFYLSASNNYAGKWESGNLYGALKNDWAALLIHTSDSTQDIGTLSQTEKTLVPFSLAVTFKKQVTFAKASSDSKERIAGAQMQILDKAGNVLYEFTSTGGGDKMFLLNAGDYVLHEKQAPDGYVTAPDMNFTVTEDDQAQKITMFDDAITVCFGKSDADDGSLIAGARMQLINDSGEVVREWVSETEETEFSAIPAGDYTIHEAEAPDGYALASDMNITVLAAPDRQEFTMKDAKIGISKNSGSGLKAGSNAAQTGDTNSWIVWAVILLVCAAVILAAIRRKAKHR